MQRSKQQALMFLLGALLVGGVVGFSADRVMGRDDDPRSWAERKTMYDDLTLSARQRAEMDSLLDARACQLHVALGPVRPQIDSIKNSGRQQIRRILTAEQWGRFETRLREDSLKREQTRKANDQCRT